MDSPSAAQSLELQNESKPRLLDLFCGAGGAAVGYAKAGFEVVGVDIRPQPNYPFQFIQADVMTATVDGGYWQFDGISAYGRMRHHQKNVAAIHASPPCQHYSDLAHRNGNAHEHPDYVAAIRDMLTRAELPWVIENVEGAPLVDPVTLCGVWFTGLRVIRHRLFESNFRIIEPPHLQHPLCYTRDKRKAHYGQCNEWDDYVSVNGGGNCSVAAARDAMGVDWMTKNELNEAIPPAYTEWVGGFLMEAVTGEPWAKEVTHAVA